MTSTSRGYSAGIKLGFARSAKAGWHTRLRLRAAAAGFAIVIGTGIAGWSPTVAAEGASTPVLDMSDQVSLEKLELRILAMPELQKQMKLGEETYLNSHLAKFPDGQKTLENAIRAIALSSIQYAFMEDPSRPKIMWVCNQPHSWSGVSVPGSGYGIDNPDNLYRWVAIDGESRYEITGKRTGSGPAQESFTLYSAIPGTGEQNREGSPVVGAVMDNDIKFADDGSFTIAVNGDAAAPGSSHLQTKPGAKILIIRDTMTDWTKQFPNRLSVRRISGPAAPPPPSDAQLADRAAAILKATLPFWLEYFDGTTYKKPVNTLEVPFVRAGGWGFASGGWFQLKDDEALVITLKTLGVSYLGFQTSDVWGVAPDYIHYTSSLTNAQAKPNADGTYSYVLAPHDPKVWNWLDTENLHTGMFTVRWQGVPAGVTSAADAIVKTEVVKISDLKKALPAETAWVTQVERKKQQSDRAASYALRLAN